MKLQGHCLPLLKYLPYEKLIKTVILKISLARNEIKELLKQYPELNLVVRLKKCG